MEHKHKCNVCGHTFKQLAKLRRHMPIHTGDRPHKCNLCAKTFIESSQLVIHMRIHTGERPYACEVCEKCFTCNKQLKLHWRTHTGEMPYACEICGKLFGYKYSLYRHRMVHYDEKIHRCTICGDKFTSIKSIEEHIKSNSKNASPCASPPRSASPACSSDSLMSSFSDMEYKEVPLNFTQATPMSYDGEVCYYIYTRGDEFAYPASGPEVVAAVVAASAREDVPHHVDDGGSSVDEDNAESHFAWLPGCGDGSAPARHPTQLQRAGHPL